MFLKAIIGKILFIFKRSKILPLCISIETVKVDFFSERIRSTSRPRRRSVYSTYSICYDLFINYNHHQLQEIFNMVYGLSRAARCGRVHGMDIQYVPGLSLQEGKHFYF
jgi:hypothetical protein